MKEAAIIQRVFSPAVTDEFVRLGYVLARAGIMPLDIGLVIHAPILMDALLEGRDSFDPSLPPRAVHIFEGRAVTRLSWFPSITLHDTRSGGELGHNSAFGWWVLSPKCWRDNGLGEKASWAGTAAQEQYEHVWRRWLTPLLWLPIFLPPFARWLELMGHAVEIVVARGDGERRTQCPRESQYMELIARNLKDLYPALFGHWQYATINQRLARLLPRAERWVARHPRFIAKLRKWEKM